MVADQSFGTLAKNRRRELGLTQDELARRVGCAPITLRKIEADDLRPSVQIAERMAMALNIPLEDRAAFVKLARVDRTPVNDPKVTPMPEPNEIGIEDLTGRAIRGYALGERLGNGGMGVVYRAVQPLVEREVAIKIIRPQFANHPDFIRRFEAEAQFVARLEHPHIVPLYDYWREPSVAYLIMRLLRGGSVQSLLRNGSIISPEVVLRIMEQIGSALSLAHRAGVVHRDLKPANVLLDEDNNAYLADFGIAKNLSSPSSDTQADMVIGSPDYISPEQIRSEYIRPQTDIYALGVMLYELLTGRVPFNGPTPFEVMHQHLSAPLPSLASNRIGLPKSLDAVIEHATAKDPLQRYETVDTMLNDLRKALGISLPEIKTDTVGSQATLIPSKDVENPYKGLRAFGEGDAQDFFGREALTQQLLVRLGEGGELAHFLAVVGPSGSGKSSVVKAGLIPALRRGALPGSENWFLIEMMPGSHPLEELEAALLRVAVNPPASLIEQFQKDKRGLIRAVRRSLPDDPTIELVLVIDQFEEAFTLLQDENERQQFLGLLVSTILDEHSRVHVVITLRADFIDRPLSYVDFGELMHQRMEIILPLTPDELESAIIAPAQRVGLHFESGLVAAILRDLGDQPGTLPLLQYALTELYEKRVGNALTKSAYQEIGGVLGALGRRAEDVFNKLDAESQTIARQIFLRLVTLGEGVEDTRRRVLRAELENLNFNQTLDPKSFLRSVQKVLDAYGHTRLLSFDRDPDTRGSTVEVAHEAIIREWTRLREWLDESRSLIRLQRQLAVEASEWMNKNRDNSYLLTGTKLAQYEDWLTSSSVALTQPEIEYLKVGVVTREQRKVEEIARQQRELETTRKLVETEKARAEEQTSSLKRLRRSAVFLAGALLISVVAAIIAGVLGNRNAVLAVQKEAVAGTAQAAEAIAIQERDLATSRELAAAALGNLDIDPERSILLALQGLSVAYSAEAENALRRGLSTSRVRLTISSAAFTNSIALSPDGKYLAAAEENGIAQVWDIQTGQEVLHIDAGARLVAIFYNAPGNQLITADSAGYIRTWDVMTGREISQIVAHGNRMIRMVMSTDGSLLATESSTDVKIWDTATGKMLFKLLDPQARFIAAAFSLDGTRLVTVSDDGSAKIWNINTGENLLTFSVSADRNCYFNSLFNADGTRLIISDSCGIVRFWDITGSEARELFYRKVQASSGFVSLKLSPDGTRLAIGENNSISIWDASTGFELFILPTDWRAFGIEFSRDGKFLVAGGDSKTIKVWDLSMPGEKLVLTAHGGDSIEDVAFSPDGTHLVTESSSTGDVRIWDAAAGQQLLAIKESDICCSVAFSPDGTFLIAGSANGTPGIWDAMTGKMVSILPGRFLPVGRAVFSQDGTLIATASAGDDGTVEVWDAASGKPLISIIVHNIGWVNDIAFSPDGKLLAASSTDIFVTNGIVDVWDVATGEHLFLLGDDSSDTTTPQGLAFSPDGKRLAVGYSDNVAKIWDVSSGKSQTQAPLILRGHSALVWKVAFNLDGTRLATASQDGTVKLWNVSTGQPEWGQEVTTLPGHTADVSGIAFSPDGKYLASVSLDGTLRIYFTQIEDLIAFAKTRVTRTLTIEECQKYLHLEVCPAQ